MSKVNLSLLFASRLVEEKGIKIVISVIKSLAENHEDVFQKTNWIFCSDGVYEEEIKRLANEYPENISYVGKVSQKKLAELYRASNILVMPSTFLETFWLTALEALACGTHVTGFRKWGLTPFILKELALSESQPEKSLEEIIIQYINLPLPTVIDVSKYNKVLWEKNLARIFEGKEKILIMHDYEDRIGWAEYYRELVTKTLQEMGKKVVFFGYHGKTTPWRRRLLFITSLFGYFRGKRLKKVLQDFGPDAIWMHSILRYCGVWSLYEVQKYQTFSPTKVFLSHHDVGLMAAFPQHIENVDEIPKSTSLIDFIPSKWSILRKYTAWAKWMYIYLLKKYFPKNITHIIFSEFLEETVKNHFPKDSSTILHHPFDETIFHP